MKSFRRVITVALAVLMILAMVSCASASTTIKKDVNKRAGAFSGKTVILHSNDVHGAIEGYAYMAYAKSYYEALGATVIVVDAGDFSNGNVNVSFSKGANAVTLMNEVGYDVVGFGNHEFDFGADQLFKNLENADFQVVCANIYKDGETVVAPDTVVKVGGLKIGFFGLDTPEAQTKVNPALIKGLTVAASAGTEINLFDVAQAEVDKLNKCADLVIGLTHLGTDQESIDGGNSAYNVWAKLSNCDFFIDAHSHSVMTEGVFGENIQSTGTEFANIGVIVIDNKTKKIEDNYLVDTSTLTKNARVLEVAKKMEEEVDKALLVKFAESQVALDGVKGNVRSKETNLGDLIVDSMVWSVLKDGDIAVDADHVVGVTNGGGIRASIDVGDVTKKDVNTVLPFGNTVAVVYCTGAELLEALEASTFDSPASIGGFPQVAGITYTVNTKIPFDKGDLYPASTYNAPKTIKRVTINNINGKPFDANATYAVVTNNFCAAGGDTYYVFGAKYKVNGFDTGIPMDLGLMNYVEEKLGGKIGSEYASPKGRITIAK